MIAPSYHVDHPYRDEIESLEYRPWQLDVSDVAPKTPEQIALHNNDGNDDDDDDDDGGDDGDGAVWISTEDDLAALVERIYDSEGGGGGMPVREIALDLEAHSHRSYAGFVCLMQLSLRRPGDDASSTSTSPSRRPSGYDFLVDALALRHAIPHHLGPVLCDPNVVKVMHGADSDVPWLQRDFGCYVVNLFDTGRAARALKFPSAGLAYLLRRYVGFDSDKAHQLSDWRRRPLPDDMRRYAASDTRYLLDVYDQLRLELARRSSMSTKGVGEDASITSVLDRSKRVCLIRYDKEPFLPSGYLTIVDGNRNGGGRRGDRGATTIARGRVASDLSAQQEAALRSLYDWRDGVARAEDESVQYVCPNAALKRIASNRPSTVAALQRLVNPCPPLVMRRSQEILDAIRASSSSSSTTTTTAASSSSSPPREGGAKDSPAARSSTMAVATSKPAVPGTAPTPSRSRKMLSPILGSEALYQQAGWMSESDDDCEGAGKLLDVDAANEGYSSTPYSSHGIELSPGDVVSVAAIEEGDEATNKQSRRGASTDGLGTARAAGVGASSIDEEMNVAKRSANFVQREMTKLTDIGRSSKFGNGFSLIDLIRPMPQPEDVDFDRDQDDGDSGGDDPGNNDDAPGGGSILEEDEMVIPKSMREIYNLSNANRRTGKEKSATSKLLRLPDDGSQEVQAFMEDDVRVAEEIIASRGGLGGYFGTGKRQWTPPGKEGDVKLMIKMGWVKDKKDAESLAVVPGDPQPPEKEGGNNHGGQQQKKSSNNGGGGGGGGKGGGGGGGGAGGTFDYYSSMGAGVVGAFDPNAPMSKNPFFAGAAMNAASMLHGGESKGKSHKRNKKR
jgi:exosome complex exonuclease RRP6